MATCRYIVVLLMLNLVSKSISRPIIRTMPEKLSSTRPDPISDGSRVPSVVGDYSYCHDAGAWSLVPARCVEYVADYVTGDGYRSDTEMVAVNALAFAKTVTISGDGMDAWVFGVDETLLSNLPYYTAHGFGSEMYNETSFDEWVYLGEATAIPASLKLYKEVQQLGFTIFLLSGRDESERNITVENLQFAGYDNWERLILRQESDSGKLAILYKSQRRKVLEEEGYTIHGSFGDQWSDLLGFARPARSYKIPNPMYYIP